MSVSRVKINRLFDRIFTDVSERPLNSIPDESNLNDWRSRAANFFGLPIDPYVTPLGWGRFFRRMTAWHYYDSPEGQKWINWTILKPIAFFALNLFAIPFKFALNIFKLVIVFLPLLAAKSLENIFNQLLKSFDSHAEDSLGRKILSALAMIPVVSAYIPLFLVGYIAHWLTSPVNAVKRLSEKHPILAWGLGVGIVVAYMALAPLAVYILGPIVLAKAATILPSAVTHVIQAAVAAISAIGHAIAPVCQFIGTYLFGELSYAVGLTAMQAGLGQLIGLAALTLGSVYVVASDKIARWYYSFRESERNGFRDSEHADKHIHVDFSFNSSNNRLNQSLKSNHKSTEDSRHEYESGSKKSFWSSLKSSLFSPKKSHDYVSEVNQEHGNRKRI